jgi:hypothetical protein
MKFCIWIDLKKKFKKTTFAKNQKYEHRTQLKFKINTFMKTTHELLHLDKLNLVQWKIIDIPTSFIWINIFLGRPFEYGDGGIIRLLWWMQNFNQSTWDHEILYAGIFRGWTTFNKATFARNQKYKHGGRFAFYFMERPHEPLQD